MRNIGFRAKFLPIAVLSAWCWLSCPPAYAEKIPSLAGVPAGLPSETRGKLNQQRKELDQEYYRFKKAADNFSAEPADQQSDAEYAALEAWKTRYINSVKAFNALVQSQTRVGAVAVSRGEFYFITLDGHRLSGEEAAKAPVTLGTRVFTGPDGRVQLLLLDETVCTMGPNGDMVIDEFVYDPNNSSDKITARLQKGLLRWVTGKAPRKNPANMKVILPAGDTGIRGTDFEAMVAPDGSGSVKLFSGQLEITEKKTQRTFLLNAGQMVTFSADGFFAPPAPLGPAIARLEDLGQKSEGKGI